jgi:inosose dehydratase
MTHFSNVKLAIAPIGWSNDDMPELGAHISFAQCIQEMADAGYQGCEVGHKFPRDAAELSAALLPHRLNVASAWLSLYFTEAGREQETIENFKTHMTFLKAMGASVIVVCECGNSIQGKPLALFNHKPRFTESQWQALISGLHQIGRAARENDMSIVYHHHMGTGVQNQDEIDYLMAATNPDLVSLLFDTGHLTYAGGDVMATLKQHGHRIKHVHLKDIRETVLQQVKEQRMSFLDSVRAGVFTVPGDGMINFKAIVDELAQQKYSGWWVVEAEQDPEKANPLLYAKMARGFLREVAGI